MEFSNDTPRKVFTVAEVDGLSVPQPFKAGHVCAENEAGVLNQTLVENVRNNMAKRVKEMKAGGATLPQIQAEIDKYLAEYKFGVHGGGGGRISDPVEAEALDQARKKVTRAIVKSGKALKEFTREEITTKAKALLAHPEHGAKIRAAARKTVADREKDTEGILADLA